MAEGSEVCVFWDFDGRDWSPDGCTITEGSAQQGIVTCQCNHLTNFAVLVVSDIDNSVMYSIVNNNNIIIIVP